jgi:hypothetical protein
MRANENTMSAISARSSRGLRPLTPPPRPSSGHPCHYGDPWRDRRKPLDPWHPHVRTLSHIHGYHPRVRSPAYGLAPLAPSLFWASDCSDLHVARKLAVDGVEDGAKIRLEVAEVEQCRAYRNAIIHHHIYDHAKGIGTYVDESKSSYQILVSLDLGKLIAIKLGTARE